MIWFDRCYYTTHAREDRLCVRLRKKLVFYIELISVHIWYTSLCSEKINSTYPFDRVDRSKNFTVQIESLNFRNLETLVCYFRDWKSQSFNNGKSGRWNFHRFENCLLRFDVWIWKALSRRINSFSWKFWKLRLPVFCLQSTIRSANLSLNCFGEHSRTVTEQTVFNCV